MTPSPLQWPPPHSPQTETLQEREDRLSMEREAKSVSDAIDLAIQADREAARLRNAHVGAKILLLGQAESGKSTILKNFQLHFCPNAFHAESLIWRPVIHLNLVRSVNFLLGVINPSYTTGAGGEGLSPTSRMRGGATSPPPWERGLSDELKRISFSLLPLKQVERSLTARIVGTNEPLPSPGAVASYSYHPAKASEVSIRSSDHSSTSSYGWKSLLRFRRDSSASHLSLSAQKERERQWEEEDTTNRRIIAACRKDIASLWMNEDVQRKLSEEEIWLRDQPGFFLEDVERVAEEEYVPTPDDVLRARVSTIGPEEHRIPMEGHRRGREWVIYDVGGSRSQRAAWAQFFDDVTVIIFLAPISAFNLALAEEPNTNRLADSLKIWRMICSNKLLSNVDLILLLNKIDILDKLLKKGYGVQFSRFVTSYKDRPNKTEDVSRYLLDMFNQLHRQHSPKKRKIHPHITCAVDTKATAIVITHIQELILLKTLAQTNIL
ncbi:G-alpha-domain-containing protein [Dendrothele bispora CBS 962.96]|uniref:G-alpha-domain-containing protein n=1 Tax=Dendrothele bispora (strain CBS 962.96) TaxID=1314807 RepID=A0A4S8LZU7_DENBC|nr:G-alpha-domain-containing protein [Dendrothele bispora CBS 962.96]